MGPASLASLSILSWNTSQILPDLLLHKFVHFCAEHNLDPWSAGIDHILTFVEVSRSTKNWSYSSVKVCVSAISLFRGRIEGGTVFRHELMAQYLKGARKLTARAAVRSETWDASLVLQALEKAPVEP